MASLLRLGSECGYWLPPHWHPGAPAIAFDASSSPGGLPGPGGAGPGSGSGSGSMVPVAMDPPEARARVSAAVRGWLRAVAAASARFGAGADDLLFASLQAR